MPHALGKLIDKALLPFAPGRALKRAASRTRYDMLSTYAGASTSRTLRGWTAPKGTANEAIMPDHATLTSRARQLVRDDPTATSIVDTFGRNVVGRGIFPTASLRNGKGDVRQNTSQAVTELFLRWASSREACDTEGIKTFWQQQRQAIEQIVEAGEIFVVANFTDNGPVLPGVSFQAMEPEQLDTSKSYNPDTRNRIIGGIEYDASGVRVAYHFFPTEIATAYGFGYGGLATKSERIKAYRVAHLFIQKRPGQQRGVTALAPIMRKLRDFSEYDTYQLWAARLEACIGMVITREGDGSDEGIGGGLNPGEGDGEDSDGNREIEFRPGMVAELEDGESVTPFTPQRPGTMYDPFTKRQLKLIAAGTGLSYAQVARDFHDGNFSSQRQSKLEDERGWGALQDFLIDALCNWVWGFFIEAVALQQLVPGVNIVNFRNVVATWMPEGWDWIDPVKEVTAEAKAIDYRLLTREESYARRGKHWRNRMVQIGEEKTAANELGLELPEDKLAAPPAPPEPPGGSGDEKSDDAEDE